MKKIFVSNGFALLQKMAWCNPSGGFQKFQERLQ